MSGTGAGLITQHPGDVFEEVLRATRRSARLVHDDFRLGLNGLVTVAAVAPLLGLVGTTFGIVGSFVACGTEKSACMAAVVERLSLAIWPTALGLLVALISLWGYTYATARVRALDDEMEWASLELVNQLTRFRGRWALGDREGSPGVRFLPGEQTMDGSGAVVSPSLGLRVVTGVLLLDAWCVQAGFYFGFASLRLEAAILTACYVLLVFAVSLIPAHFLWIRVLRRRPGGLGLTGSAICLAWCILGLIWPQVQL